ncbi:MAG: hypothetical protein EZS28_006431 [Streblomastix strix]|uniref:Uncharacterized protein n=1 Tax=Streblomastix strix TaxID=222440 RepID=A0A5J4WUF0_9EUKA|nr:MAG: hypothetical protein EZS28_006431 [Streblomastix strix]
MNNEQTVHKDHFGVDGQFAAIVNQPKRLRKQTQQPLGDTETNFIPGRRPVSAGKIIVHGTSLVSGSPSSELDRFDGRRQIFCPIPVQRSYSSSRAHTSSMDNMEWNKGSMQTLFVCSSKFSKKRVRVEDHGLITIEKLVNER